MKLKKLIPFDNFEILTDFTAIEVLTRISNDLTTDQAYGKLYKGTINGAGFKMSRIIGYRNSFLPVITGKLSPSNGQTKIILELRPSYVILIFYLIYIIFTGLICLMQAFSLFFNFPAKTETQTLFSLIPFFMFIFGLCLGYFAFWKEADISRAYLQKVLKPTGKP